MTRRFYADAAGLLISRAGYTAGPGMAEIGKAFDSNWPFVGIVMGEGTYTDPTSPLNANNGTTRYDMTSTSSDHVFVTNQPIVDVYTHMVILLMKDEPGIKQTTTLLPVYYRNSTSVKCPRVFRRWSANVNVNSQDTYTRLDGTFDYIIVAG